MNRVTEKTELAVFLSNVVSEFEVQDVNKYDTTLTDEDRLAALRFYVVLNMDYVGFTVFLGKLKGEQLSVILLQGLRIRIWRLIYLL